MMPFGKVRLGIRAVMLGGRVLHVVISLTSHVRHFDYLVESHRTSAHTPSKVIPTVMLGRSDTFLLSTAAKVASKLIVSQNKQPPLILISPSPAASRPLSSLHLPTAAYPPSLTAGGRTSPPIHG